MSGAASRHSRRTHVVLQLAAALIVLASVLADGSAAAAPKLPGSVWGVAVTKLAGTRRRVEGLGDAAEEGVQHGRRRSAGSLGTRVRGLPAPGSKAPPHTRGRAAVGHGVHELPPARGLRHCWREAVPHGGNRARPASGSPARIHQLRGLRKGRTIAIVELRGGAAFQRLRLAPRDRCRPEGASPRSRRRAHRRTCGVGARRLHAPARRAHGGPHARAAGARHSTRRRRSVRHARAHDPGIILENRIDDDVDLRDVVGVDRQRRGLVLRPVPKRRERGDSDRYELHIHRPRVRYDLLVGVEAADALGTVRRGQRSAQPRLALVADPSSGAQSSTRSDSAARAANRNSEPVDRPERRLVHPPGDRRRVVDAQACGSWNAAYQAASPGDTVLVRGGTYPSQRVLDRTNIAVGSTSIVFRPAPGESILMNSLQLYAHDFILDGGDVGGQRGKPDHDSRRAGPR